jgi:hypothetical protein
VKIEHFQFREVKSSDYFRKAWKFSFMFHGQFVQGIYHQNGSIEWQGNDYRGPNQEEVMKDIHRLMEYHIFS